MLSACQRSHCQLNNKRQIKLSIVITAEPTIFADAKTFLCPFYQPDGIAPGVFDNGYLYTAAHFF